MYKYNMSIFLRKESEKEKGEESIGSSICPSRSKVCGKK